MRPSPLVAWMPLVTVYSGSTRALVSAVAVCGGSPATVMVAELVESAPFGVVKFGYFITTVMVAVVPGLRGFSLMSMVPPRAPSAGTVDAAWSTEVGSGVQPTNSMFAGRASVISPSAHSVTEQV